MKQFKSLLIIFVIALIASTLIVFSSAIESPAGDPCDLTPGSERVIFVKDADSNGYLEGDGIGYDANNPLRPLDHEDFDPAADNPKFDLQTAWYQATELLKETGGTIVICGPVTFTKDEAYGNGAAQQDVRTAVFGKNVIKFTSVYNGIDYRKTNNAHLKLVTPAQLSISGSSIWENINIVTSGTERVICFEHYPTLIGKGVKTRPYDPVFEGVASCYVSLAGGKRYGKGVDVMPTLTVQSGTYNKVVAGMWGVSATTRMESTTTYLTLEGTTTVLGSIIGTTGQVSPYGGNVNITINDGTYDCDIFAVGKTGLSNNDGTVNVKINGGDFTCVWSNYAYYPDHSAYNPANSTLDLSDWNGSDQSYETLLEVTEGYKKIISPAAKEGWVEQDGDWYYYENNKMVKDEWRKDSVGWVYLTSTGKMAVNAIVKDSNGYCYVNSDGYFEEYSGWKWLSGYWYYLTKGYCTTNAWRLDSTGWCYLSADGKMVADGFARDSKGICYLDKNGYFEEYNGWKYVKGGWYYLYNGYCETNSWKQDSKGWCYVGSDGRMLTNSWVEDSVGWCYVGSDGYCITNSWMQDSKGWCFLDGEGRMVTSMYIQDSKGWCYIDKDGYWDGKYYSTPSQTTVTNGVWIPTVSGTKYHSTSTCSNMIDPVCVSVEDAIARGFTKCKKCS